MSTKYAEARQRLEVLEAERNDFDIRFQLEQDKRNAVEADLKKYLDEAYKEVAELEKGNVDHVRERHSKAKEMEKRAEADRETIKTLTGCIF